MEQDTFEDIAFIKYKDVLLAPILIWNLEKGLIKQEVYKILFIGKKDLVSSVKYKF